MIPWVQLDAAKIPDSDGELRLMRRGTEYSIMTGAIELMNSRLSGSEEALATLSIDRLAGRPAPRLLIGGLGMGFTLRAALARLGPKATVDVAEISPAVIAWAGTHLAHIFEGSLQDPRVSVIEGDVGKVIGAAQGRYDAILLDVDNGPGGLDRDANDSLYAGRGLHAARRALTPGGILAVWSSGPSEAFTRRLQGAGYQVEEARVRASRSGRGARHVIWLAATP
jgi:spermidine synthase